MQKTRCTVLAGVALAVVVSAIPVAVEAIGEDTPPPTPPGRLPTPVPPQPPSLPPIDTSATTIVLPGVGPDGTGVCVITITRTGTAPSGNPTGDITASCEGVPVEVITFGEEELPAN
jgi:hypothetical protein